MSKYKPSTVNSARVIQRRIKKMERAILEANLPTRTQTYATTSKISQDAHDFSEVFKRLGEVEVKVSGAVATADSADAEAKGATATATKATETAKTALAKATEAQEVAQTASEMASKAIESANKALETAENATTLAEGAELPIGAYMLRESLTEPDTYGTWVYVGATTVETTDEEPITLHLYMRTK